MATKHLVTSGIKDTRLNNNSDLFLGSWCLSYSEEKSLLSSVLSYHWDDRSKLKDDHIFIQKLYKEFIEILSIRLNLHHKTKYSKKYWEILIGPWLNWFISIIFDRFYMLNSAFKEYDITSYTHISTKKNSFIPNDMSDFVEMVDQDSWNQNIFQDLINKFFLNKYNIKKIEINSTTEVINQNKNFKLFTETKTLLKKLLNLASKAFSKPGEVYIQSVHLSLIEQIQLQLQLKIFPRFWFKNDISYELINLNDRSLLFEESETDEKIFKVLKYMISRYIPLSYLENYIFINDHVIRSNFPKSPSTIFTCDSYGFDDVFKTWSAKEVDRGSRLVIGQHGGHYGIGLFDSDEQHQISISHKFLTWGWRDPEYKQIQEIGLLTKLSKKKYNKNGGLLIISTNMNRYSYRLLSVPIAGQWQKYHLDQKDLVENLSKKIRNKTTLRPFQKDYGRQEKERWATELPKIQIDNGKASINKLYRNNRLIVHTYNATSYLETLALNYPTIIVWDSTLWEIRPEVVRYFDELERSGIFHKTSKSAASHINHIWEDIDDWWYSRETQETRRNFCKVFADNSKNKIDKLSVHLN